MGPTAVGAYNSVLALVEGGRIAGRYDKAHLVPYGEYCRCARGSSRSALFAIGWRAASIFSPALADAPSTSAHGARSARRSADEIVFRRRRRSPRYRPDYIFNPSNYGWFGSWVRLNTSRKRGCAPSKKAFRVAGDHHRYQRGHRDEDQPNQYMHNTYRSFAAMTALMPVVVARRTGSPSSIARIRACARCWGGPQRPNQPSFEGLKM